MDTMNSGQTARESYSRLKEKMRADQQEKMHIDAEVTNLNADVRPQTPMEAALNRLNAVVNGLDLTVGALEVRLATVMEERSVSQQGTAQPPAPEPGVSRVVSVITHAEDRLVMLRERVDQLISCLHV